MRDRAEGDHFCCAGHSIEGERVPDKGRRARLRNAARHANFAWPLILKCDGACAVWSSPVANHRVLAGRALAGGAAEFHRRGLLARETASSLALAPRGVLSLHATAAWRGRLGDSGKLPWPCQSPATSPEHAFNESTFARPNPSIFPVEEEVPETKRHRMLGNLLYAIVQHFTEIGRSSRATSSFTGMRRVLESGLRRIWPSDGTRRRRAPRFLEDVATRRAGARRRDREPTPTKVTESSRKSSSATGKRAFSKSCASIPKMPGVTWLCGIASTAISSSESSVDRKRCSATRSACTGASTPTRSSDRC